MDFGKLASVDTVDFTFPPQVPETAALLSRFSHQKPASPAVYVGCPVWTSKEWVGKVYPSSAKEKDYLSHYSRQFSTIELNTTHYRIPDEATINRWNQLSPGHFKFCPKFPQVISHEKQLQNAHELTLSFCDAIRGLNTRLGISFIQLPPYFSPQQIGTLEQYLKHFPTDIPLSVEFRHPQWFRQHSLAEPAAALLEQYGVSTVITDVAGRRDVLHQRLTTPVAVIRFVGNGLHPTDYRRVDDWIIRLKQWFSQGLHTLYFFVHEPDNRLSPELVSYTIQQLNSHCRLNLTPPRLTEQPIQGSLF